MNLNILSFSAVIASLAVFATPMWSQGTPVTAGRCPAAGYGYSQSDPHLPDADRAKAATASQYDIPKVVNELRTGANSASLKVVVAHRGYWEFCPENSVEAYMAAMDEGVEAIEMDVRLDADDDVVLGHDFDKRGEAVPLSLITSGNVIHDQADFLVYHLSGNQLDARSQPFEGTYYRTDRHGNIARDSNSIMLKNGFLYNLFNAIVARARLIPGQATRGTGGFLPPITRGALTVIDVKLGEDSQIPSAFRATSYASKNSGYQTLLRAIEAERFVEAETGYDLSQAVIYKLSLRNMPSPTQFDHDLATIDAGFNASEISTKPQMTYILFPSDVVNGSIPLQTQGILAAYEADASTSFVNLNINANNPGATLGNLVEAELSKGHGVGMFQSTLNFPECSRYGNGLCQYSGQPMQKFSSASFDFSLTPEGSATSITSDLFQNAAAYLRAINQHDVSILK